MRLLSALCLLALAGCDTKAFGYDPIPYTNTPDATGTGTGTNGGSTGTGTGGTGTGTGTGATGTGTGQPTGTGTGQPTGTGTGQPTGTGTGQPTGTGTGQPTGTGTGQPTGTGTGTGGTPCVDDPAEPNDDQYGSWPAVWNQPGLVVSGVSQDWFYFDVLPGETATVDVLFADVLGDIDARLYSNIGVLLDQSETYTDNEQLVWTNNTGAVATIHVQTWLFSGTCNSYELRLSVMGGGTGTGTGMPTGTGTGMPTGTGTGMPTGTGTGVGTGGPGCPSDDPNEPNDLLGTALPAIWNNPGLSVLNTSPDFWYFDVQPGETATVDVLFSDFTADVDVRLYDEVGGQVDSGTTSTDNEQVSWTNASLGIETWRLEVYLYSGTCNDYELLLGTTQGCGEDPNEPNEDRLGARAAVWNDPSLAVVSASDDWWSFQVNPGQTVQIDAFFSDVDGDIDIELQDSAGGYLDSSAGVLDQETVGATNNTGKVQTWYLWVELYSGTCNNYEITLQ